MKKKRFIVLWVMLFLLAAGIIYNIYDNGRVVIAEQNITLDGLPETFEGYRILQISDLHGKYFGKDQSRLLALIHSLDYDCILLTGDMNKYAKSDETSSGAVFALLDGLGSDKPVYWVDGNTGPFAVENLGGSCTGELTPIGKEIEEKGVRVLLEPVEIERDGQRIWFVPPLDKPEIAMNYSDVTEDRVENCEQYVSAGLGASANISFLGFRLFDTPEINLLTLHGAE